MRYLSIRWDLSHQSRALREKAPGIMRVLKTLLIVSAIVTLLPQSPVAAQTADNFLGTWKLNVAKSKYDAGQAPKALTVTFEKAGAAVKITAKGTAANGTPINTVYT